MTTYFKITMTERAAYEDLLVYWEYGDCYYQIEELEKYAVMPTPEDISDIPDIKTWKYNLSFIILKYNAAMKDLYFTLNMSH